MRFRIIRSYSLVCDYFATDHLTRTSPSFFGHIASNVSGSIFHCERMAVRIDRCTDDLIGVCPAISVEGWNLPGDRIRSAAAVRSEGGGVLFEHGNLQVKELQLEANEISNVVVCLQLYLSSGNVLKTQLLFACKKTVFSTLNFVRLPGL